ncbi:MAG: exodeoxyribonuclease VII small subunit [Candidatus Bipolaricaulis sp.]|nr:exodeoxyribonuclease VII small subunit [Candidatus Bipolaricaulis sp.]MDD5219924.1 exodeoxyribonuclease VII small subunit [Candidatus Bipolaricaulis sp.]MDD5645646.1 exodeoxyribonuclease VII small subunit [Candidatus Bipolaricaulis sp.]
MKIEETLVKLEEITSALEREDLPLDEAIALFEQGLDLAAAARKILDEARLRIEQVIEKAKGVLEREPFDVS